jgi:chaperonin GroEL
MLLREIIRREVCAVPHKEIRFRSEARQKILRGASELADAVRITLDPKSKRVLIEKSWGKPLVCDDGVIISKEADRKDPDENLAARILREAAARACAS